MTVDSMCLKFCSNKEIGICPEFQHSGRKKIRNNGMPNKWLVSVSGFKFAFNDFLNRFIVDFGFQPGYDV